MDEPGKCHPNERQKYCVSTLGTVVVEHSGVSRGDISRSEGGREGNNNVYWRYPEVGSVGAATPIPNTLKYLGSSFSSASGGFSEVFSPRHHRLLEAQSIVDCNDHAQHFL